MSENKNKKSEKTLLGAYKRGFYEGMATITSVFNLLDDDIIEKLHSIDLINGRISELYHIWMGY